MASSHSNNDGTDQLLIQECGSIRVLTLNRPRQLNALSFPMIMKLLKKFVAYEKDPIVKLLILKGKGRAFCAGGDVAAVAHSVIEGSWTLGAHFFWNEFILNYLIATYRKPQVSILDGIVMGGGAGLSIHGRFRVATEKAIFAMPETSLGLFPDIGASYFLSRLSGSFGEYVGLTGARLDGSEMLACGLATHFVPSLKLALLEEALEKVDASDHFSVCSIIDRFSNNVPVKESSAFNRLDVIDKCFSKETVEAILSSLELEAVNAADEWIKVAIQSLKKASPISLKITLRALGETSLGERNDALLSYIPQTCQRKALLCLNLGEKQLEIAHYPIREGRTQGIGQCLIKDYRLCCHILRKEASKDFFEGCRALLVIKDKNPKWEPSRLDLVDDKVVDNYFSAVDDANWEDLRLPARPEFKYGSKL